MSEFETIRFKESKKDQFFRKNRTNQVKIRGDSIFNNFDGVKFVNPSIDEIQKLEQDVKSILSFNFMSKDWASIQGFEPSFVILFSALQGVPVKVKTHKVRFSDDEDSIINISYEIMKQKSKQTVDKTHIAENTKLFSYIFRGVAVTKPSIKIWTIKNKTDLIELSSKFDDKYKSYLPIFSITGIDPYLIDRVSAECCPVYRNDYKLQVFSLYLSIDLWNVLDSVSILKGYFDQFTFEPFWLNKFNATRPESLKISHASNILNLLLNAIIYEDSIYQTLENCSLKGLMMELLLYVLSDAPAITIKEFSDNVSNQVKTFMFCNAPMFMIPTITEGGLVSSTTSFQDNLTDYNGILSNVIDWCEQKKLHITIRAIKYMSLVPDRNTVVLSQFFSGFPNITGYTSSDQVSAVKRQIFTGRDILHKKYEFNDEEARDRAELDWNKNMELLVEEYGIDFYNEHRQKYFDEEMYKRDYVPLNFDCNGSDLFKSFSKYVGDFTESTSSFAQNEILDLEGVLKHVFDAQTPNSAGASVVVKIPVSHDSVSKIIKTKSQNFNTKHLDDFVTITLKTKRSLVSITPMRKLLDLKNVFKDGWNREISYLENLKHVIPYLIKQGNRTIPGPKQIRFIFVVPWPDNVYHQSIGFNGLRLQKRMDIIGKPTGIFLKDYAEIIHATSTGLYICLFLDFSVFDGSCMNYIQRFIYSKFKVYFNFIWSEGITIGELLEALQMQKYRCVLVIYYAGEYHLFFLDMILSGELLTNYKDSVINYALIRCAIDALLGRIPKLEIVIERNLKINGDDSFMKIKIPTEYINTSISSRRVRGRSSESQQIKKISLKEEFRDEIDEWAKSLPDYFEQIGFKLSDAKGGAQMSFAEYLKVWIKFGIVITHWRIQLFSQEKTSVLQHNTAVTSVGGLGRTMVERGMKAKTIFNYVKLLSLSGRRTATGTFFVNNIIDSFNPSSGYSLPLNERLYALPNTSIFSLYVFMHSKTKSVPNEMISRYLLNNFERTQMNHLDEYARQIANNNVEFIRSDLGSKPEVNSKEYYNTRDPSKINKSLAAYTQLKEMGFTPSRSTAYFNGFQTYISSGLASSKVPRGVTMMNYEKANGRYFENVIGAVYPIGPFTPEMLILSNIFISKNEFKQEYHYVNDLTNMAIGSDPTFFMFKDILGYASLESHPGYERDIIDLIKIYDPTYPRELSQEVLLKTLLKPEILSNQVAFTLTCILLGLNESVSEVVRKTLNDNFLIYSVQSNAFNYSSVSQFINMWDFDVNRMRDVLQLGPTSGELSMVDRLTCLMSFLYVISIVDISSEKIIVNGIDVTVGQNATDVVTSSRSF